MGGERDENMSPKIQVRPRFTLLNLPEEEKIRERDRLIQRVSGKVLECKEDSNELTPHSHEVVQNIADALDEYPELQVVVHGFLDHHETGRKSEVEVQQHSTARALACAQQLQACGALNDLIAGCENLDEEYLKNLSHGGCRLRVASSNLLEPQARLDWLLQRHGFGFEAGSLQLPPRGRRLARAVSKVLQEAQHSATLTLPRGSSDIAIKRSEVIVAAIHEHGPLRPINVGVGDTTSVDRAQFIIDGGAAEEVQDGMSNIWDPQQRIIEILRETPLAFRPNSADLVPEVLPVIRRIAEVLRRVENLVCLVEAFSGTIRSGSDRKTTRQSMQDRAQSIVHVLQDEDVTIRCVPKGYASAYSAFGNTSRGPCIVITLVNPGEEYDVLEDDGDILSGCFTMQTKYNGCMTPLKSQVTPEKQKSLSSPHQRRID